jgi:uncharacterized protein (DUF1330 family)
MEVVNAVYPSHDQFQDFFDVAEDAPFVMVNLLKFKERAEYEDDPSVAISGREAYERYGIEVSKLVEARGGRIVFTGDVTGMIVGQVDDQWDMVALAEYPSHASFMEMMLSPEWAAIERHRVAGLAGQLNIRTTVRGDGTD